tara:strand:+ start:1045 stop:1656 length:612 start_codon:yes stop_codon:yes gene_type:complete
MPKQTVIRTNKDKPKGFMDNFLVLHDQAIQGWVCESIMDDNNLVPLVDIIEDEGNKFMPVEEKYRDSNHRYESQGRIHTNIYPHTPLFESIMDMVGFALPKGGDFEMINYMQIIQYKEGTHFPWHMDIADSNDTGTMMLFLNDNFLGGDLTVNGTTICTKQGSIVGFNKSTETWHSVSPLLRGERFVLAIWFCKDTNEGENAS